jgi:hypothetical protein
MKRNRNRVPKWLKKPEERATRRDTGSPSPLRSPRIGWASGGGAPFIKDVHRDDDDLPPVSATLACRACGHEAVYPVGSVFVDPGPEHDESAEPRFSYSGYFRCRSCGSGGPWRPTPSALLRFVDLLARFARGESVRIHRGALVMFDGTIVGSGGETVDRIRRYIAREPRRPFLYDRLGNAFDAAGLSDEAMAEWRAAVAIDPEFLPSLFSIGMSLAGAGDHDGAVGFLHRAVRAGRRECELPRGTVRALVRAALKRLLEISDESGGRLPFLPPNPAPAGHSHEPADGPLVLRLDSLDLRRDRDWEKLTDMFAGPA